MTGLSALLGGLGLVGVFFALVSFILAIAGMPPDLSWIIGNGLLGLVLLLAAAGLSFDTLRERVSSGEARRAGKYGTSAVLTTALSIAILAMLAFLASRYPQRADWSEQKIHSLSDQTQKVLAGLERDVQVQAFYQPIDAPPIRELLDRYSYASEHFQVEYINPVERPQALEKYGVTQETLGAGVVRVAFGDESTLLKEATEERVTNAMVKLSRTTAKQVYFLEGHNECAIEGESAAEKRGCERASEALRNENYRVDKLLLAASGDVPEDADVVIISGATRPLMRQEHAALERYLGDGGSLLVQIDPRAHTDLIEDLARWGVEIGEDIVVDRRLALFGQAFSPFAERYGDHDITRDLREPTLFNEVRSVRPHSDTGASFTEIVFTGQSSWGERDFDLLAEGKAEFGDDDLEGPVPVAVAGEPALAAGTDGDPTDGVDAAAAAAGEDPRLVVFGDSDFMRNEFIEAYRNRDLFLNSVNWLLGDIEAISIRPNRARASRFQLTTAQFNTIRSLSLFVLPEAIAILGVLTWWSRRKAVSASGG